jgi:hypothetical protein
MKAYIIHENDETKKLKSQPILNSTVTKIGKMEWISSLK